MKLFVTGAAGFIGSNFARRRAVAGDEVTIFDALTYAGNRSTIADVMTSDNVAFVHADIRDAQAVHDAMAGHDAVVHFAAESHVDRSIAGPEEFVSTNCVGTSVVMQAALNHEVDRVIHISTDETYGSIEEGSFVETDMICPRSPYSASKAGSDHIALSYYTTYGLPVTVTRASNNFGPYQHPEKLIPRFITNIMEGKRVPLMGDGQNVRDWMFVDDHCAGIDLVLSDGAHGEIYNIGAGNEVPNKELTMRILAHFEKDESWIETIADRLGHDRRYSISTEKLHALGWKPAHSLDEALAETIRWYETHRAWWEPLKHRDDASGGVGS